MATAFIVYFNFQKRDNPIKLSEFEHLNNKPTMAHMFFGAIIVRCMVLALRQAYRSAPGLQRNSERMRGTKRGLTGRQRYSDVGVGETNQSHHKAAAGHTESRGGG
jgi:hypothetical protein